MNKTNLMRGMTFAASLLAASACGSVMPTDSSDYGSGSGMDDDSNVGASCESGSDCAGGTACDMLAHECVADVLTLDETDFLDDGLRFWASTSNSVLRGKYEAGAEAVVQVKVGTGAPVLATTDGTRWTAQLPMGTIMAADQLVTVTLTDPERGVIVREQAFALDNTAPVIALEPSTVRDERGDVIDFSSGAPVHDHQGEQITLGAEGCAIVHKYAYLMDTHAPMYGGETAPNPITWAVTLQDTRIGSAEFRVRNQQGTVLRDWKPIAGSGSSYPVTLHRDGEAGIGELATKYDVYTIDVRARDWGGLESNTSYCIDFRPLAAPLHMATPTIPTDPEALSGWTFAANSPISRITKPGNGAAIVEQRVTQYSSEPVVISVANPTLTGNYHLEWFQGWMPGASRTVRISCATIDCNGIGPSAPQSFNGSLNVYTTAVEVLAPNGSVLPGSAGTYVIPGRAAGAPPAQYRVRAKISDLTQLGHNSTFVYGERLLGPLNYTGTAPSGQSEGCTRTDAVGYCTSMTTYYYIRGLDRLSIEFAPFTFKAKVSPAEGTGFITAPHVPAPSFTAPGFRWDAGDEDTL